MSMHQYQTKTSFTPIINFERFPETADLIAITKGKPKKSPSTKQFKEQSGTLLF